MSPNKPNINPLERPNRVQEAQHGPPEAPRRTPGGPPGGPQEAPRRPPGDPQETPEAAKRPKEAEEVDLLITPKRETT